MNTLILKIIISMSFLPMLGALTNCGSKAVGSIENINITDSAPSPNNTPIETVKKMENLPTDLSKIPTVTYCDLVKNAAEYDRQIVRLRVVYFTGFEKTYFYDSRCEKNTAPEAPENVPAQMWAEWDKTLVTKGDSDEAKMNRQMNGFGRKDITVIGRFYSTNEQNDPNAPTLFGHMNCCRFLFRIMRVEKVGNSNEKTAQTINDYGKLIKFAPLQKLEFADFTLEFNDDVRVFVAIPQPGKTLPKSGFRITRGNSSIMVWENEAGDNAPLKFEFGGAKYQLEAGIYDKSGRLAADELILTKLLF